MRPQEGFNYYQSSDHGERYLISGKELSPDPNLQLIISAQNIEGMPASVRYFFVPHFGWTLASDVDLLQRISVQGDDISFTTAIFTGNSANYFSIGNQRTERAFIDDTLVPEIVGGMHFRGNDLYLLSSKDHNFRVRMAEFPEDLSHGFATASARGSESAGHYGINYDAAGSIPNGGFVADGAGYGEGPFLAKLIFKRHAIQALLELQKMANSGNSLDVEEILFKHFTLANSEIKNMSREIGVKGSTTGVIAFLEGNILHVMSVGDSKAYIFKADGQVWNTPEQGVLAKDLRDGLIDWDTYVRIQSQLEDANPNDMDEEALGYYSQRNIITHSLGENTKTQYFTNYLQKGDRVLLVTDAVPDNLTLTRLRNLMSQDLVPPVLAASVVETTQFAAVNKANPRRKVDDASAVVLFPDGGLMDSGDDSYA